MTLTPERKMTVITVAIIGAIVLLGAGGVYYLQFNVLSEARAKKEDLEKQVKAAEEKRTKLPGLRKVVESLKEKETKLDQVVPKLDSLVYDRFINLLNTLRKKNGVYLDNIKVMTSTFQAAPKPGTKPLPQNVKPVEFELKIMGGFWSLLRFLYALEINDQLIIVEKFSITPKKTKDESGYYEIRLNIRTFTYEDPLKKAPEGPKGGKEVTEAPIPSSPIRE